MALRLLTCSQSGAVIAAPTCSLPEAIGGTRNWDYRYCWPRDSAYILGAFAGLGQIEDADAFFSWLLHATRLTRPQIAAVYNLYGATSLGERELCQFEGYRNSGPVRSGNAASNQLQLDVYGSVVEAVWEHARAGGTVDPHEAHILRDMGRTVCDLWRQPDDGIWEFRGPRQHTTYGKAMCWCALDRLIRMDADGSIDIAEDRFRSEADELRATILRDGWNERRGCFTGAFGEDWLDAALLTLPRTGLIEPGDPAHARDLRQDRGRALGRPARPAATRTASTASPRAKGRSASAASGRSSTWRCAARVAEARRRFEALLGYASDLGLYAEEIDPATGEALGNYPQAADACGPHQCRADDRRCRARRKGGGVTIFEAVLEKWDQVLLWGGLATVVMTTVLEGAQVVGLSRLSFPFLFGTFVTGNRRRAEVYGYILYAIGAWLFAIVYALIMESLRPSWWLGLLVGIFHGLFLIVVFLELLNQVHPRIATRYEGPSARRRLEPPGAGRAELRPGDAGLDRAGAGALRADLRHRLCLQCRVSGCALGWRGACSGVST